MGPTLPTQDVYLRTRSTWARGLGAVRSCADARLRWGIFLAERDGDKADPVRPAQGRARLQKVTGEYRASLRG